MNDVEKGCGSAMGALANEFEELARALRELRLAIEDTAFWRLVWWLVRLLERGLERLHQGRGRQSKF